MFGEPNQLAVLQMMLRLDTNEPIPAPEGGWRTSDLMLFAAVVRHMAIRSHVEGWYDSEEGGKFDRTNKEQGEAYVHECISEAMHRFDYCIEYVKLVTTALEDSGVMWMPDDELEGEQ